jgi:pyridoxal 5'-phosphate synthase pdxT subunit
MTSPSSPPRASCCNSGASSLSASESVAPLEGRSERLRIGVLASQGDFAAHARALAQLGAEAVEARRPAQLAPVDALVIPGGESTTIAKAIQRDGLGPAIGAHHRSGRPILGTCAGMILCGREHLGLLDITTRRNAFGRQLASFEADLEVAGLGDEPFRAVFIRAPWVAEHGDGVEVLAGYEGHPVAVRQGSVLACAFHPELTDDLRFHAVLMAMATARPALASGESPGVGSSGKGELS